MTNNIKLTYLTEFPELLICKDEINISIWENPE